MIKHKTFSAMTTKNNSNHDMTFNLSAIFYGEYISLEIELLVIKGKVFEYSTILQPVKSIDLSKNNLSREIPKEVISLQGLQSLNLSYILLSGSILENIGFMGSLESIDFSVNKLQQIYFSLVLLWVFYYSIFVSIINHSSNLYVWVGLTELRFFNLSQIHLMGKILKKEGNLILLEESF